MDGGERARVPAAHRCVGWQYCAWQGEGVTPCSHAVGKWVNRNFFVKVRGQLPSPACQPSARQLTWPTSAAVPAPSPSSPRAHIPGQTPPQSHQGKHSHPDIPPHSPHTHALQAPCPASWSFLTPKPPSMCCAPPTTASATSMTRAWCARCPSSCLETGLLCRAASAGARGGVQFRPRCTGGAALACVLGGLGGGAMDRAGPHSYSPLNHLSTRSPTSPLAHSLTCSPAHSLTHSPAHSLTRSPTHSLAQGLPGGDAGPRVWPLCHVPGRQARSVCGFGAGRQHGGCVQPAHAG